MSVMTWRSLSCRLEGDRGASLVEYALLVSLIAMVCIGGLRYFQSAVSNSFSNSSSAICAAQGCP
jgi:Flp pilus assembly pilin Flp